MSELAERLAVGGVVLDRAALLVTVDGTRLRLAMQEFKLLELLMEHADHVLPTTLILDRVWGPDFAGDPGTVAVHMLRLRKKLERQTALCPICAPSAASATSSTPSPSRPETRFPHRVIAPVAARPAPASLRSGR